MPSKFTVLKLAATIAMLVLALIIENRAAQALPVCQYDVDYYADGTFGTEVGQRSYNCSGAPTSWGSFTDYFLAIEYSGYCNGGYCPFFEMKCDNGVKTCEGGTCPSEPCSYFE
jgi:hypothetical protein